MKLLEKAAHTFEAALQRKSSHAVLPDIDVVRQNTPPDELDAELAEAMEGNEFAVGQGETAVVKARARAASSKT